ncbi:MAG: PqiC family protein [Gemmatimonadota bacterium]
MTVERSKAVLGALVFLAIGGCSLGRGAPAPQHFVLGGEATVEGASAPLPELEGMTIGIRRLQLASYLGTPFIVVRRGDQAMTFAEFDRWGEPLAEGINRAVAGYLRDGAAFAAVDVAPWPPRTDHDFLIELNVLRFEGVAPAGPGATAGEVHVLAEWQILRPGDSGIAARGTSDFRQGGWEVGDHASLVGLMNTGLRALAVDLMTRLATLGE